VPDFQSSLPHLLRELRQIKPQQKFKASNAAFYRKFLSRYAATTRTKPDSAAPADGERPARGRLI